MEVGSACKFSVRGYILTILKLYEPNVKFGILGLLKLGTELPVQPRQVNRTVSLSKRNFK
jgi:hypothetical protein